jgi:hypothetical protein
MEKAYDLKELGKILAKKGLPIAEEMLEHLNDGMFEWLEESANLSKTVVDDMLKLMYPSVKGLIKDGIDQVDGKEG